MLVLRTDREDGNVYSYRQDHGAIFIANVVLNQGLSLATSFERESTILPGELTLTRVSAMIFTPSATSF